MNLLDKLIAYVSPESGLRRAHARANIKNVEKLVGSLSGPYNAAKLHRLSGTKRTSVKENEVSGTAIDSLRAASWNLFRNNGNARKIVRTLEAKIVGRGLLPESLATRPDGSPAVEFRDRAKQLWQQIQSGFDSRGLPGKGGRTFSELQKLALRNTILSGECLYRLIPITGEQQAANDLPIPVALQLIDACRFADDHEIQPGAIAAGNTLYRGIELSANGERLRYWLRVTPAWAGATALGNVKPFDVRQIGHLFIEDDIDQLRGVPWFAAAIVSMQDTADLQYNVLKASAMAACFVGSYSLPTGAARFGLNQSTVVTGTADGTDLTDADGNQINKIQPGLLINRGKDGAFDLHSPNQPNLNPEAFVQHLQRGTASAFPGVKSSTITGDYRNSSFSSERSADNDCWPELHDVQEWFASSFCQPIYESVLRTAVMSGYFDGIISPEEFAATPGRYSATKWQGPVALSINPTDDAKAASMRIAAGLSSPQMECAKVNVNWRDVLNDIAELYAVAEQKDIPEEVINNVLGVDTQDTIALAEANNPQQGEPANAAS